MHILSNIGYLELELFEISFVAIFKCDYFQPSRTSEKLIKKTQKNQK